MGNTYPNKQEGCIAFLQRRLFKSKFNRLISAIKHGNLTLVKYYHSLNVNFTHYMDNGDTPLHVAVKYNKLDIVKWICENAANVNVNDKNFVGDTPLILAVMNGNIDLVRYLILVKKVDANLAENKGFTPFMAACANGNLEIVKLLIGKGLVDITMKSYDGQTGLHRAAFYGNYDVLVYLIKHLRMNVLVPDRKGNLPLHSACMKLNVTCARLLLRVDRGNGTSLYMKNKYEQTPLEILLKQFNRLKEDEDPYEFKMEELLEYLKDKNHFTHKYRSTILSPANITTRRGSVLDRAAGAADDLKKKLKGMFAFKGSAGGSNDYSVNSYKENEQDQTSLMRLNGLADYPMNMDEIELIKSPTNQDLAKVPEELFDLASEEQRLNVQNSSRPTSPNNLNNGLSSFRNLRTPHSRATALFASKLSTIRKGTKSPSAASSVSFSDYKPSSNPETPLMKRLNMIDSTPQSPASLNGDPKQIHPSHFSKVRSRFALPLVKGVGNGSNSDLEQN